MTNVTIGKVLDHQAKQIIYNVYTHYKIRKMDPKTQEHQEDINIINVVAQATGISKSSVTRVVRDGNNMKFKSGVVQFKPQERKFVRKKRIEVNEFTESVIRRRVIQFYTMKKDVPSVRKLNALLKKENILNCSNEYLRQLLHKLGFTNGENERNGMLMERKDIVSQRFSYIQALKEYRAQNRNVFFLNETSRWLNNDDADDVKKNTNLSDLIALHVSGNQGFKSGSILLYKFNPAGRKKKDEQTKHIENYDWVCEILLPQLPPGSVVVLNTSPVVASPLKYGLPDKPTSAQSRSVVQEWLNKYEVPFKETDSKAELLQIADNYCIEVEYNYADILKENYHEVLHIPRNHPDLNPLLIAWNKIKDKSDTVSSKVLFDKHSKEDWQKCFNQVIQTENEYYQNDVKYDETVDSLLLSMKKEKHEVEDDEDEEDNNDSMEYD